MDAPFTSIEVQRRREFHIYLRTYIIGVTPGSRPRGMRPGGNKDWWLCNRAQYSSLVNRHLGKSGRRRRIIKGKGPCLVLERAFSVGPFLTKEWQAGKLYKHVMEVEDPCRPEIFIPMEDHQEMSPDILVQGRFRWRQEGKPLFIHICKGYIAQKNIY
ncbi:hypothetical protein TESG_08551 [Trichophyton tonsurans CBS 112818]|uniref:Uncharacterized protein n=1 Tax=Trichophyton tonsurans (strain CBS 112818) TaxID=647933 RepID=F2S4Q5_TRIT1|nr:hypothetical protein TESG_08551 [Trichophyton tonsurans CBS 112818]